MSKLKKIIQDPRSALRRILAAGDFSWMPDKPYLKLMYYAHFGKRLDLKNPKTYNEKIQWLKLYDRKPEYTTMVDKYEAKKYVAAKIGEEYIIPNLGVWERAEDIDFDALPDQFVLKCTHDSGRVMICRDKSKLDVEKTRKTMNESLKREYFYWGREWPYKDVKPRIIAERYMEDEKTQELRDYKCYCFAGVPKIIGVFCDRSKGDTKADYFDPDFNHLDITWGYPHAANLPQKPASYDKMMQLASVLSEGIPQLRVDFYEVNGQIYFGELTFFDAAGLDRIDPYEWNERIGSWITLPGKQENESI